MLKINMTEDDGKLILNFNNGTIEVPKAYGAYAICPGCGSGKTTISRELIKTKWHEGILYAAFTKNELEIMYQYCLTLVGSAVQDPLTGEVIELRHEDIALLHSDYSKEGTDEDLWRNRTYELANKKIILCTHHKLQNEPLELLMAANFNGYLAIYDPQTEIVNGLGRSYPRQWVIIDEIPDPKYVTKTFKKVNAMITTSVRRDKYNSMIDPNTGIAKSVKIGTVYERVIYSQFLLKLRDHAWMSAEIESLLPDPSDNFLNEVKKKMIRDSIYRKFYELRDQKSDDVVIKYMFTDMINPDMKTHILLMDGTADISLPTSSKFTLLNINERKYMGCTNINVFPYGLTRRLTEIKLNEDEYLVNRINEAALQLIDIIRQNKQTLIFTWKDLKELDEVGTAEDNMDMSGKLVEVNLKPDLKLNKSHLFYKYLEAKIEELSNYTLRAGVNFSVEYYGSGKDKAINDYRDYDAIALVGKYQVPNKVFGDFDNVYGTKMERAGVYYYLNRVVQAICRTRIRKHDGSSVNVYFSNDWDKRIIAMTDSYMNDNQIDINVSPEELIVMMTENLKMKGVTPERADRIAKLSLYDNQIYHAIMNGATYELTIPLDTIFQLIPMSRKKSDMYRDISKWLKRYGISLNIVRKI